MKEYKSLYWIGVRESEISCTNGIFAGSITAYGSNMNNNYSFDKTFKYRFDCNKEYNEWIEFVNDSAERIISKDPNCKFVLYYPADYPYYSNAIKNRVVYINDAAITDFLENKILSKLWLSKDISLLPFTVLYGSQINLSVLNSFFNEAESFVVQGQSSCGGSGTWLLSNNSLNKINQKIKKDAVYMVTPYKQNALSVNIHLIIYKDNLCLLPASVQIITLNENCLCYNGGDYVAYKQLPPIIKKRIIEETKAIGDKLRSIGYLGVCGLDFLVDDENIYFMEINSRFQASTMAINRALSDERLPLSVQQLHIDAFNQSSCSHKKIFEIPVNYSFAYFTFEEKYANRLKYIYHLKDECNSDIIYVDDNIDWSIKLEKNAYLYEIIFKTNISGINSEMKCYHEQNINIKSSIIDPKNFKENMLALKIMLFNHSVRITDRAEHFANSKGGLNFEEFNALDMEICNKYINVPFKVKNSEISPFEIDVDDNNNYILLYFGEFLSQIKLGEINPIGLKKISNEFTCNDITYLGNDRLRIYFRNSCYFKEKHIGCKFCDIVDEKAEFTWDEIKAAVDKYWDCNIINHYLIGGGSNDPNSNFSEIIQLTNYIRTRTSKPISLMSIPPLDVNILHKLKSSGIDEVMFNLEIYDRKLAKKYMPGKGEIPLSIYENAFRNSVELWGKNGKVRTMFIVGLESKKTLLDGVEFVCKLGVSPTLALFKPIANTPLEHMFSPPDKEVYEVCQSVMDICKKYNVPLGPSCIYCEDNVLKINE